MVLQQRRTNDSGSPPLSQSHSSSGVGASSSGSTRKKVTRGKTTGKRISILPEGTKLTVDFDAYERVIGKNKNDFVTMQGVVIRNNDITPLGKKSWHEIDKEKRNKILDTLLDKFDIGDDPKKVKIVERKLGKKWKDYRCELKRDYYKEDRTTEANLENRPEFVCEEDWRYLVIKHWNSEKIQEISRKNKEHRDVQQLLHRTGRKSFAVVADEEFKKTGFQPSRIRMFELAYAKPDGIFPDVASQQKGDEIKKLTMEREEGLNSLNDEEIFIQVFGPERNGRLRCMGHGPTMTSVFGSSIGRNALLRQVEEARKEAADTRRQMEEMQKKTDEKIAQIQQEALARDEEMRAQMARLMEMCAMSMQSGGRGSNGN